MNQPRHT